MISRKSILSVVHKHFNTRTRSEFEMFMPVASGCFIVLHSFISLCVCVRAHVCVYCLRIYTSDMLVCACMYMFVPKKALFDGNVS